LAQGVLAQVVHVGGLRCTRHSKSSASLPVGERMSFSARALLLAGLSCAGVARSAPAPAAWAEVLEKEGFVVQEGEFGFFDVAACKESDTCYVANPLTPYGLAYMPPHPEEAPGSVGYVNTCHAHKLCRERNGTTLSPGWRVVRGEAVVIVGRTPPEAAYWSFGPNLYTRYHERGWVPRPARTQDLLVSCKNTLLPFAGNRCETFSSVDDPINLKTANISGASSFGQDFALVLAWDSAGEAGAREALESAGQANVNVLRFPGAIGVLGVTSGKEDEWLSLLRVESIKDEAAASAYYGGSPLRAFRVTPPKSTKVPDGALFPSREGRMRNRFTGAGESAPGVSFADLAASLEELQDKVKERQAARWKGARRDLKTVRFASFVQDSGYECLEQGTMCQGDCRDTIYAKATFLVQEYVCNKTRLPCSPARHATLSEDLGDELFVVGVNHKATNQAIYSSVTAYDFPKLAPVTPGITDDQYAGTAEKYLGAGAAAAKYLYVVKFARACAAGGEDLCVAVPAESGDPRVSALHHGTPIVLLERMYLNPKTNSGPAVNETILPVLMHWRPYTEMPREADRAIIA